ncbi:hypothetical protein DFH09DRAFT_1082276 [Mycena vulgaris]|nr:hypothetical protein DFH09DRAFT_1082276 [Mycena vulgaris]
MLESPAPSHVNVSAAATETALNENQMKISMTAAVRRLNAGSVKIDTYTIEKILSAYMEDLSMVSRLGSRMRYSQPFWFEAVRRIKLDADSTRPCPRLNTDPQDVTIIQRKASSSNAIPDEVEQASHFVRRDVITIESNVELRCRAPAQLVDGGPQTTLTVVPGWIRAELASTVLGYRRRAIRDDVQQLQVQLEHLFGDRCLGGEDRATGDGVELPPFDFDLDLNQSDGRTAWKMRRLGLLAVYLHYVDKMIESEIRSPQDDQKRVKTGENW